MAPSPRTQTEAVNDGVRGTHTEELRNFARGFGEHARGVQGTAGGESLEILDVSFEDAHVAVVEALRGAPALLHFRIAGGRTGIDEDIADAELFDKAERFLAGAGADGEHTYDRADAKYDAESGEERPRLLGAEVGEGLAEIREENH